MKKKIVIFPLLLLVVSTSAQAGNVDFGVNINIGNQPRPVAPPPPPVVVAQPPVVVSAPPVVVPASPQVVIEQPPVFIMPPALGFYAAVGIPYDLFYISGAYYLWRGDSWFRGDSYNGPWVNVSYKRLPSALRHHRFEKIRYYRDHEYRVYQGRGEEYRGRHFRPDKEWKEHRKEEHERWKEEKRAEKEERKYRKHHRDDD